MSDLVSKIRPFFDCGSWKESATAIECFASLTEFATDTYKDVYMDNVHGVFVSLTLHAHDENEQVQVYQLRMYLLLETLL